MEGKPELPPQLKDKLRIFRGRARAIKLAECFLAAAFGLLFSFCLLYGLDRLVDTQPAIRLAILVIGTTGLTLFLPLQIHKWIWNLRKDTQAAKVIRKAMPRFGDQLLGIVELVEGENPNASPELVKAALRQVDVETGKRDLSPALPKTATKRWAVASLPFAALTAVLAALTPEAAYNALLRWSQPFSNIPRYTFTGLERLPDTMVVPFAEPFTVEAHLKARSKVHPETAQAQYGTQRPLVANATEKHSYTFEVPPQREPAPLVITAGDDTATISVLPTLRPELAGLQALVKLPAYLGYDQNQTHEARSGSLQILRGSEYRLQASFTRPCQTASINGQSITPENGQLASSWSRPEEGTTLTLEWTDGHGLSPKEPFGLAVTLVDDEPPSILIRESRKEQFLLTTETLPLDLSASDDYGIRITGISWEGVHDPVDNPEPHKGEKTASKGSPQSRTLQVQTTLNSTHLKIPPQTIRLRAYAEDYSIPARRAYSPHIVLHILDPEEHALHITELYTKWQRNTLEIYERERQLNDRNKSLRTLSTEQLADPENQRAIAEQARAEEDNARKLGQHTQSGEELLQQATRNPNFEGDQLEKWAGTLQSLKDIANNRMPNVADLLQKAVEAAGNPQPKSDTPPPPTAINDESNSSSGQPAPKTGDTPPPAPTIKDIESSLAENQQPEPTQKPGDPAAAQSRLTLPGTTVPGIPGDEEEEEPPEESPAQEALREADEKQEELLKQFAKVTEALNAILRDLEGSTFVKRLKAASRTQMQIATQLNNQVLDSFGLEGETIEDPLAGSTKAIAETQTSQGRIIENFLEDLDAYIARVGQPHYEDVLSQMEDRDIQPQLVSIAQTLTTENHSGNSISASQYWADQFDIWADQLVIANEKSSKKGKPGKKKAGSLPPELILAVMRILREEIDLREDTRAAELARDALEEEEYAEQVLPLQETQYELAARTKGVVEAILKLPRAKEFFGMELGLLNKVQEVMFEAEGILGQPNTGPDAIGAETEAIELLLQAKRACNKGGGGGGSGNSPGGGGIGSTTQSALAMVGEGNDKAAKVEKRKVGQSTGNSGAVLPAEYKNGLDAYFHALENL